MRFSHLLTSMRLKPPPIYTGPAARSRVSSVALFLLRASTAE